MKQYEERNLSMVMDAYELTMSNAYFLDGQKDVKVAFDVFYRRNPDGGGFAIFAGLQQIVDYIENLHFSKEDIEYLRGLPMNLSEEFLEYLSTFKFKGDIYSLPEGTIMYPNTPIITVIAPVIDAQLVETALLIMFNHQSLIATKARRVVKAADGRIVADFGARRGHNADSAVYGARAAYIGGVSSTATVLSGQMFDIPLTGTMAHSYIMFYKDEYTAFKKYALQYPDSCTLLVDTYDVLKSGIPNAIKVAKKVLIPMNKRLKGIRLDSGDLAYLSKKVRKMLDEAGLTDCKIVVSNSLDEFTIKSLINQGAKIDAFGVGERLITAKSEPVFGGVYKISGVKEKINTNSETPIMDMFNHINNSCLDKNSKTPIKDMLNCFSGDGAFEPRIKISENVEKITNPGLKKLWRVYNSDGYAIADLLTKWDETVDMTQPYCYVDQTKPWKNRFFENCTVKQLQVQVFKDGELAYDLPTLDEIRNHTKKQLDLEIWDEEQRFENPHTHYLDMSPALYEMKITLLHNHRKTEEE